MLTLNEICKTYPSKEAPDGRLMVLNKVSLNIEEGKNLAIIGESGSGKSTLGRIILALEKPDCGTVLWNGKTVTGKSAKKLELYRYIQPVFQNSTDCFNPRLRIRDSVTEPMRNFFNLTAAKLDIRAKELMEMVELSTSILEKYPHELSGGQQKRVCIARAVSINPKLLVLDEALTGLDATVKLKILKLLRRLHIELDCAYLFITHDLRAAHYIADTIAVINKGVILEVKKNEKKIY